MAKNQPYKLKIDSTEVLQIFEEIDKILKVKININGFRDSFLESFNLCEVPGNLFSVNLDRTEGTLAFYMFKPTKFLTDFLAALRAWQSPGVV